MSPRIPGGEMKKNIFVRTFLLLFVTLFSQLFTGEGFAAQESEWSQEAALLSYEKGIRHIEIFSPDRRKIAIVDGVKLTVMKEEKCIPGIEDVGVSMLAELLWSPKSTAFSITESYGGAVGDWHVTVYEIKDGHVHILNVANEVVKSFKKHYRCKDPEDPNVGAVKWLNGGKLLLLAAEVPPHSSCPEMGKLRGYIVEIPTGRIVREFDERKLRADWGHYLGRRLSHKKK
jgi:hypothetical protein